MNSRCASSCVINTFRVINFYLSMIFSFGHSINLLYYNVMMEFVFSFFRVFNEAFRTYELHVFVAVDFYHLAVTVTYHVYCVSLVEI